MNLIELERYMSNCKLCRLCQSRSQVVFGEGGAGNVMIIGEGPGDSEDRLGHPFVEKAGKKLDNILKFVNLKRKNVYITNSVLCRPPENRTPFGDELDACKWRLLEQIKLIDPQLIILLGRTATTQLLGPFKGPLKQYLNKIHKFKLNNKEYDCIVNLHPSYLLRNPDMGYTLSLPGWKLVKDIVRKNSETSTIFQN